MVHQLESGAKLISLVKQPAFVFASLWPSWFFAARSAGFESLVVCVEDAKPGVDIAVKAVMSDKDRWLDWAGWRHALLGQLSAQKEGQVQVLIQGPRDAINRVLEFLSNLVQDEKPRINIVAFATSESSGRRRAKKRQKLTHDAGMRPVATLSHHCVGGVLDQAWTVESNVQMMWDNQKELERSSVVKASLQDYLSRIKGGDSTASPVACGSQPTQVVGWKRKNVQVTAGSVFSKTGWVRRKLTINELMDVYDVSVEDRQLMHQAVLEAGISPFPLEFTQQIPVRVLLRCFDAMRKSTRDIEEVAPEGDNSLSMFDSIEEETGDWESRLCARRNGHSENKTRHCVSDEEKRQAKNDDAVATIVNWNKRVCDRLSLKYEEAIHASALDKIRDLQMLWYRSYRGGVIRSFRRYMHMEYGKDWLRQMREVRKSKGKIKKDKEEDLIKDYDVGIDAITRALSASFWEWDDGSTISFGDGQRNIGENCEMACAFGFARHLFHAIGEDSVGQRIGINEIN
jgi:hypothetical protein